MPNGEDSETMTDEELLYTEDDLRKMAREAALMDSIMKAQEREMTAQLPTSTPPAPTPVPVAPPPGKMYMGPNITPQQFAALPAGMTNRAGPAPVLPPEQQAALQRRLALATGPEPDEMALARLRAADRPGSRTIAVQSETRPEILAAAEAAQRRYEAEKQYRYLTGSGMSAPEAFSRSGLKLFTPPLTRPLSDYQRLSLAARFRDKQPSAYEQGLMKKWESTPSQFEKSKFDSLMKRIDEKEKDLQGRSENSPAAARIRQEIETLQNQADAIERRYEKRPAAAATATATTRPPAARGRTAPKVGEVYKGYKFLGGDPNNRKNWRKVSE